MDYTKTVVKYWYIRIIVLEYDSGGRILLLLCTRYCRSGAKKKKNHGFLTAKNTACGVRFLLRFNMYLFLDQCDEVLHLFSAFVLN